MKKDNPLLKLPLAILGGVMALGITNHAFAAVVSLCVLSPLPPCDSPTNSSAFSFGHGVNSLHNQPLPGIRLAVGSASGGDFCSPRLPYAQA